MTANHRLIDDHARDMAQALLHLIAHNYREETHHEIWEEFIRVCRAGIEAYDIQCRRMELRLKPSRN